MQPASPPMHVEAMLAARAAMKGEMRERPPLCDLTNTTAVVADSPAKGTAAVAKKQLTLAEAIGLVQRELGLEEGGTLRDAVGLARAQLNWDGAPSGTLKDQVAELCAELGIDAGWEVDVAQTPEHQIKTRRRRRTAFLEDDSGAPGSAEKFLSAVTPKVRFDPSTPVVAPAATPSPRSSRQPGQHLQCLPLSSTATSPPQPATTAAPCTPDDPAAEAELWSTVNLSEAVAQTERMGLRRRSHSVRRGARAKDDRGSSSDAAESPSRSPSVTAADAPLGSKPDWTVKLLRDLSLMEQLLLLGLDRHGNLPHNGLMDDTLSKALRAAVLCELALDGALCLPPADNTSAVGLTTSAAFPLTGWSREPARPGDAKMRLLSTGMTAPAGMTNAGDLCNSVATRTTRSRRRSGRGIRGQADAIIREALSLLLHERGEDVALPPCEWMEDLLEQGSGGTGTGSSSSVGLGNLRRRLGQSLVDQQICEEKSTSGLFFNTVRYLPTWRWKDESSDCTDSTLRTKKIEQPQQQQRWTSREALVEQLQDWLLQLPGESCLDASSAPASQVQMDLQLSAGGRMAALCGLAELCGVLRTAVLDGLRCDQRDAALSRLSALRAESALGDHEALMARWGWPPALACVMAYVVCSGSSGSSWF